MGNIGFLKRALPFLGTFALGLFVASFFVNLNPRFEHSERSRCHREMLGTRIENEQLREENRRLRERHDHDSLREYPVVPPGYLENENLELPNIPGIEESVPVMPPPPPPAAKSHKVHKR